MEDVPGKPFLFPPGSKRGLRRVPNFYASYHGGISKGKGKKEVKH